MVATRIRRRIVSGEVRARALTRQKTARDSWGERLSWGLIFHLGGALAAVFGFSKVVRFAFWAINADQEVADGGLEGGLHGVGGWISACWWGLVFREAFVCDDIVAEVDAVGTDGGLESDDEFGDRALLFAAKTAAVASIREAALGEHGLFYGQC